MPTSHPWNTLKLNCKRRSLRRQIKNLRESADWYESPAGQNAITKEWNNHVDSWSYSRGFGQSSVFGVQWDGDLNKRDRLRHEISNRREAADARIQKRIDELRSRPARYRAEADELEKELNAINS